MSISKSIVFLPGWGFRASVAKGFLSIHAQLFDLPLLKKSHFSPESICDAIEEKIQPTHPILMGWSLGGLLAIKLYERNPNTYKALILITSTPCFRTQRSWPSISKEHETTFRNMLEKPYPVFFSYYLKLIIDPFQCSNFRPVLKSHIIPEDLFNAYKSYADILFQSDLRLQFSKIQIPTLVIQGEKDLIVPNEILSHLMELNPLLEYHNILGANHIPFITHHMEIKKIIRNFLKKIS